MASGETNGNGNMLGKLWLEILTKFGFPVAACVVITWFAYDAIKWERNTMLPAITDNTEVLRSVKGTLENLAKRSAGKTPRDMEESDE